MIASIHGRIPVLWLAGLLALLATGVLPAAAPPWVVRTWQSDEGLPDNTVVGIEQTPDGFLWVATKTGLVRFDGVRFQPFPVTAPGAPAGGIKALLADRRGRLWVAKDYGLVLCVDQGVTTLVVGQEIAGDGDGGERLMVEGLAVARQQAADLHALYQCWIDRVTTLQAAAIIGTYHADATPAAAARVRETLAEYRDIDARIQSLRAQAARETQISRRVDLNLEIKGLELRLSSAISTISDP